MSSIYANNRDLIDDGSDRYFLVRDRTDAPAVERQVVGGPDAGHPPLHPDHEERGERTVPVDGGVLVEEPDLPRHGERVWLKGFGCVRHTRDAFEWVSDDIALVREEDVPVVHWAPAADNVPVRMRTPDGDVEGYAEPDFADVPVDEVVQFERVGFVRVDEPSGEETVVYYAHP